MTWQQKIEAQIERLLGPPYCHDDPDAGPCTVCIDQELLAAKTKALLDVAVAADVITGRAEGCITLQDWTELYVALDKLREVGDE